MSTFSLPRHSQDSTQIRPAKRPRVRVIVVDDHPAIQVALSDTFDAEMDLQLCGCASNATDAFALVEREEPDVAVIDVALQDAHGLDLMQNLRAQHPELQVVIFSMYDEAVYAERALRAGALGYVMKQEPTQRVVEAIRSVARGEVYLSRRMASRMLSKLALGSTSGPGFAVDELTDREMAVFQMLGQGQSVQEITDRLSLSRKTVETYRRRAKEKLGFDTVSELQQYAIRWRLKYS
jgi:DNA-binding NarL/FixJ family response regulator